MDKDLLEERNLNRQKQEGLTENWENKSNKLNSSLAFHETIQDNALERIDVPAQVQAEIDNSIQKLAKAYDKIHEERGLLRRDDPEFTVKNLGLVEKKFKAQVEYSREKDLAIQKVVNEPVISLEEAWENRENKYREFKHASQIAKDNIAEGLELDKLIESSESGPNKGSGSNNQGPVNDDQGSNSLVEDFADPNLEQPSYMDPDD